jgi:hypothetical protein
MTNSILFNQGLVPVLNKRFPNAFVRFCVKHLYDNFKSDHKGDLLKKLENC